MAGTSSITTFVGCRMPNDLLEKIRQLAQAEDRSVSYMIVKAAREYADPEGRNDAGIRLSATHIAKLDELRAGESPVLSRAEMIARLIDSAALMKKAPPSPFQRPR